MNWEWSLIPIFIIIMTIIKTKTRGYFWKDKSGNELTLRQFLKRWKNGIEGITPLQQAKSQMMGLWISITGIIAGIVVVSLVRIENMWWWILIILIGSLVITGTSMIGMYQKYLVLKKVDQTMKELEGGKK